MENYSKSETTIRDLLRVVFRHKLVIITVFVVVLTSVYIGLELRTPVYQAEVRILVAGQMQKDIEVQRALGPGSLVETQMMMVKTRPILKRTVEALKLYERPLDYEKKYATKLKALLIDYQVQKEKESLENMTAEQRKNYLFTRAMNTLAGRVTVSGGGDTSMFSIIVSDYDPRAAAMIANVISRSYVIFDIEQQIAELQLTYGRKDASIIKLEHYIEKLKKSLDGRVLPDIEALGPASVKIVGQARGGRLQPLKPNKSTGILIAIILGIASSISVAYGFEYFDHTIKSGHDVEKFLRFPFVGSVPEKKVKAGFLIKNINRTSNYEHSLQKISNRLYLLMKNKGLKSVLMADMEGLAENIAVIADLGKYLAQKTGLKVIMIDADLRTSTLSELFHLKEYPGLADVLEGRTSIEDAVFGMDSGLFVLPSGFTAVNPVSIFESNNMRNIIRKVDELYDIVLINCADMKNYNDAIALATITDGFMFILNEGKVKRQVVQHVIAPLEHKNINRIGMIMNNCKHVIPEIIYKLT